MTSEAEDFEWAEKATDPVVTPSSCGSMRSPQYQVDHIGRHMKSSKLRHAWTFFLEATELKVELEHSRFSGKKKILVDGKLVFSTTAKQLSWCWEHPDRKATIKLDSDNGRHSLRCEEPEKPSQISMALEKNTPSSLLQNAGPVDEDTAPSPCAESCHRTPRKSSGSFDAEEIRQNLSARYAVMDEDLQEDVNADVAEEAIPSFPSGLTTRSRQRVSLEEVSTETARLNALLGVKDAQIAALQDQLRRCAVGKEGAAPAVETGTPSSKAEPECSTTSPVSPIRQLEGPKSEQHLVAELPTLPVASPGVSPQQQVTPRESPRAPVPGAGNNDDVATPVVMRHSLDDEELDVSHRRGPVVATPMPGTPCRRCMTPPRVSPVVRVAVATPRVATPRGARQVEAVEPPVFRGRAGSMPPPQLVPCVSPPAPRFEPRSSGRPGRASTPCQQQYRSLSVQPQRWRSNTPGPQHRSIGDAMLQVPRRIFHAPVQCQPQPRLVPGALAVQPLVQQQLPRQLPLPMQVALPQPAPQRALGPPPLLAPVMWRPESRIMGQQPWVQIGQ